jgi:ribosome-associated heat shock protein Hsp15
MNREPERGTWNLEPGTASVRVDVWLDVACLFKTRSEAKRACETGKVDLNGEHAKPHRVVHEGDKIRISRGFGRHQTVIVRGVIDAHVKKSDARTLYEDLTPKPTPQEIGCRRHRQAQASRGKTGEGRRLVAACCLLLRGGLRSRLA